MRDILGQMDSSNFNRVFGGKTVLLGGDFRQVLPVVEGGSRLDTIDASITNSYLWGHVKLLKLIMNMRLLRMEQNGLPTDEVNEFNKWVLSIGDGTAKGTAQLDDGDSELIEIPRDLLIPKSDSAVDDIIRSTYPDLETSYSDPNYLRERAIIAPKNDTIDEVNSRVLSLIPGHEKFKGIPPHKLVLKVGAPVMLLRNLNQSAGLCNGTRLIITQLGDRVIEAQMEYNLLSEINPTRRNWRIKVRVARMWHLSGIAKGKGLTSMELALVDEEGVGITACIGQNELNNFKDTLMEGHSYFIKNFQVSKQARRFNAVPSTYTIYLTSWTIVQEVPVELSAGLPHYIFNFVDFQELDSKAKSGNPLVDVIGQLTVVHPVVQSSGLNGPSVRRSVEIRDLSDQVLTITLWGEHATSFEDEFLIETIGSNEPVVIIFAGVQVKPYLGVPGCRSGAATKWYIDIDIPEVNAFRSSLHGRDSEVLLLPGDGNHAAGAIDEANSNRKTIAELLSLDPHETDISYKLNAVIEDSTGRVKIFLFGGVAEQIVRRTAAELVEESSSNQMLLPVALRGLARRVFPPPPDAGVPSGAIVRDTSGGPSTTQKSVSQKDTGTESVIGTSSSNSDKDTGDSVPNMVEASITPEGACTPPPETHSISIGKNSSTKGRDTPSNAQDEPGSVLGKRARSARKELFSAKKEKASDE
ncbi:hypothetical protein EJB05_31555, partial [Eragrostis curvula]